MKKNEKMLWSDILTVFLITFTKAIILFSLFFHVDMLILSELNESVPLRRP